MFFELMLASSPVIDLRGQTSQISSLTQFGPTMEGFIRGLLFLGAVMTFAYMLWGAVDWIMSAGDSGKVESARKKITHAIIGLVVLSCVGVIFLAIQSFLGINVINTSPSYGPNQKPVNCQFVLPGTQGCP